MGNRAVITIPDKKAGVYVHWNGGVESVCGVLDACRELGYRGCDTSYVLARVAFAYGVLFGKDGLSLGVGALDRLDCDNGDNGVYVVDNWKIVERYGDGSRPALVCDEAGAEVAKTVSAAIVSRVKAMTAVK